MTFKNKKNLSLTKKRKKKNSKGISYSGGGFESLYDHPLLSHRRDGTPYAGPYTEREINFLNRCNSKVYGILSPNIEYDGLETRTIRCVNGSLADIYIAFTEIKKTSSNLKLIKVNCSESFQERKPPWYVFPEIEDFTIKEFYDPDGISSLYGQICTATDEADKGKKGFFMTTILDNKENLEKFKKHIEVHYGHPFRVLVANSCKH